jgi:phage shock protein PspC (stress-responsive transcriptional regulator)
MRGAPEERSGSSPIYERTTVADDLAMETPTAPSDASSGDTSPGSAAGPAAPLPPRLLSRSRTDRLVAGVAGGLGEYFDLDPIVFRIAFVVFALIGGSGLALYGAGWLLLPEEGHHDSLAASALRGRSGRPHRVLIIVLICLAFAAVSESWRPWRFGGVALPLVLIGLGVAVLYSSGHPRRLSPTGVVAPTDSPGTDPLTGGPGDASAGLSVGPPAFPAQPPRPASLVPYLLGVLALLGGLAALVDVAGWISWSMPGLLATALALTGVAIVAGALRGRVGGLVVLAALLAMALVASLTLPDSVDAGVGNQVWHPLSTAVVQGSYRFGVGDAVLDLRDVTFAGRPMAVRASVGVGHLEVIVPSNIVVQTRARAGLGDTVVFGDRVGGLSIDRTTTDTGPNAGTGSPDLRLNAQVGVGRVEVERAP